MPSVIQMIALARLLILALLMTWVATGHLLDASPPDLPESTFNGSASLESAHQKHFLLSDYISKSEPLDCDFMDDGSKKRKMGQPCVLDVLRHLTDRPLLPNSVIGSTAIHPRLLLFSASQGPRAPPSVVS